MAETALKIDAKYDDLADVLYVTKIRARPDRYSEDADGLVWRFDQAGAVIGVTVQAYSRLWGDRAAALVRKIAAPLHVDERTIAGALPH